MGFLHWLTPGFLFSQLNAIDEERKPASLSPAEEAKERIRVWQIIGIACVCLLLVHYGKYSNNLTALVKWFSEVMSDPSIYRDYHRYEYRELLGYIWWGSINLLGFLIIPMLAIRWWFKDSLSEYGWQWGSVHHHWRGYVLLASPILVFAIIASFGDDFSQHYPFYNQAHRSWFDLLSWEVIYVLQFIAVEFFFRGYLVNGLKRQFGSLSIAVMCLPYLMLHFPKLWPESFGAILFGFFLGVLALMSRSIWGGVLVHVSIALMMDVAALLQTKGLPQQW
ncbi:CPBP family intramembrane glutamic endopeptidase [Thalassolituus sp.]|uniref:CPBP family intramembrane glutamic endopeptidase n=1 Tax=Thalassolituus sp. TaxID=2030822 RepID=UPI0027D72B57|nr:CPBP family intramembrane glutamic endopeptidase [Thalassolituus sp.]MDQ4427440.1 CPBP family intramembrane metalloprotease [Thalassolituus sp.]